MPYGEPYRNEHINHFAPLLDVVITPFGLLLLLAREPLSLSLGPTELRSQSWTNQATWLRVQCLAETHRESSYSLECVCLCAHTCVYV